MIQEKIAALLPEAVFEENTQWPTLLITGDKWRATAELLRHHADLSLDYLFCVTAVDMKTHFNMVYHLESTDKRHIVVVKAKLEDRVKPELPTVCDIWRTAEMHEREAYDLMGIRFTNHPDLRRLFLTEEWVGYPLRKDYDDPINMIKL
jgi:NADH:ubiquinone oxidoreductase subunit C